MSVKRYSGQPVVNRKGALRLTTAWLQGLGAISYCLMTINQSHATDDNRERARLLYAQGLSVTQISKELNEKRPTVASWKTRDAWVRASIFENVTSALQARLLSLIGMEKKGNAEYKEIDEFTRQLERMAKIQRYNDGGNGATLNPKLSKRYKEDRKAAVKNLFTEEEIDALEEAFNLMIEPYKFQQKNIALRVSS